MVVQEARPPSASRPEPRPRGTQRPAVHASALRTVFDESPGALAVLAGPELRALAANAAYHALTAHPEVDPVGHAAPDALPAGAGALSTALVRLLASGEPLGEAVARSREGGHLRAVAVRARRIAWEGIPAPLLAAWDATALDAARGTRQAQLAAMRAAERAAEDARRAMELEQRLLGVVGHDLRTPLAAVQMAASLLARGGRLSEEQSRTLARIAGSAARMAAIVRDLLDFTRIRREGGIPVRTSEVDLAELCRSAVSELQAVHPGRAVGVVGVGPIAVEGDRERLLQAVSNLVGNALQHGPPGSAVGVEVTDRATGAMLRVHNEGPAIPRNLLPDLFQPFRRGDGEADPGGSLGLGLFIVREVVRAHGGTVEVETSDRRGTTFTVRLPHPRAGKRASRAPHDRRRAARTS